MIIKKKKGSTETLSALVGVIIFTIVAIAIAMLVYNYLIIPSGLQRTLDSIGEKIDIIRDGEMLTIAGNSGPPLDYFFFGYNIFAYRKDIKEYDKYVQEYLSFGDHMNYLYNKIK